MPSVDPLHFPRAVLLPEEYMNFECNEMQTREWKRKKWSSSQEIEMQLSVVLQSRLILIPTCSSTLTPISYGRREAVTSHLESTTPLARTGRHLFADLRNVQLGLRSFAERNYAGSDCDTPSPGLSMTPESPRSRFGSRGSERQGPSQNTTKEVSRILLDCI